MREIKFRAWDKACNCYAKNWKLYLNGSVSISDTWATSDVILEQYTGLKDKNGKEIYEGDTLTVRTPIRLQQTHAGDNIPLGSYTEPLEPFINKDTCTVVFERGLFYLTEKEAVDNLGNNTSLPLSWEVINYSIDIMKEGFLGHWSMYDNKESKGGWIWDKEDDGDLQYLLEEYELKSEKELVEYLGIEVIGNIHEN